MLRRRTPTALFERLLKEKDRQIEVLADQVDYLRMLLAERGATPVAPLIGSLKDGPGMSPGWTSEEEDDLLAMREAGHLSKSELDAQLERLRGDLGLDDVTIS